MIVQEKVKSAMREQQAPLVELIPEKDQQNSLPEKDRSFSPKNFKSIQSARRLKEQLTRAIEQQKAAQPENEKEKGEYNLELLLLRERMISKNPPPAPG